MQQKNNCKVPPLPEGRGFPSSISMTKYIERMTPIWSQLKRGANSHERAWNNALLAFNRKGDYLIKRTDKHLCLMGIGYVDYGYRGDDWLEFSTRKYAQWFTQEEIRELNLANHPGYKIVKK